MLFADHVNSRLVKWCQRRAPSWLWGSDMAPTISARLSRPCSGILALCGCMYTSYVATLNSTICFFFLLWLSFCHHPSQPRAPSAHPLIYIGPILMHSMKKIIRKLAKTSHYLLVRLFVQKLIDNYVSIIMLSKWLQYQGKAGFLIEFLKWYFSKYCKCKLSGFLLRQSHIIVEIK